MLVVHDAVKKLEKENGYTLSVKDQAKRIVVIRFIPTVAELDSEALKRMQGLYLEEIRERLK